jgi:phenylalanyl-tRNA synthetase alpha chain
MNDEISKLEKEINDFITDTVEELDKFKHKFLSRKGVIANLFSQMSAYALEERKVLGGLLNNLKVLAHQKYDQINQSLNSSIINQDNSELDSDFTIPPKTSVGSMHPITIVMDKMHSILSKIGFSLIEGPEIEDEWHNFTALNIPPDHPARDMQDTFYVQNGALRSQTSSAQIRVMGNRKPPIRVMSYGKCYRNETISARSHCFFNQLEVLYINKDVSFLDLKTTFLHFVQNLFGRGTKIRLRPSYFPFTEPSAEADISCTICKGSGCKICKNSGWLEMGGCGMVDPQVLINCNIDPNIYSGFAWGFGIERVAMLIYQIDDIRLFTENNTLFLRQFAKAY